MPAVQSKTQHGATDAGLLTVADLVLLRVASAESTTRAELQRDLASLVAPRVPGTTFRRMAELAIGQHTSQGMMTETKGRLVITPAGARAADSLLPGDLGTHETWEETRNSTLVAMVLGLESLSTATAKALERAEGLAALVLQKHFGLPLSRVLSINDLRASLAIVALERAFGNKIKTGLGKGSGLPGKTARLLAGQLLRKPKEFSSDGKLIAALSADVAGASGDGLEPLRLALLRKLTAPKDGTEENAVAAVSTHEAQAEPKADNDAAPLSTPPPALAPPDMSEFAGAVLDAARPLSEGWPGNRKAFISRVWQAIRVARREWDLTEIAFKSMLAEAHRAGRLVLTTADLKDKSALKELEDSQILYKNTVWHFVRVED